MGTQQIATASAPVSATDTTVQTVVIVDDQRTFGDLLQVALEPAADLRCVGSSTTVAGGLAMVRAERPHLVVMDYQFEDEDTDGVEATAAVMAVHPDCRVVLLTGHTDPDLVRRAAAAGACSVMPKNGSLVDLLRALRAAKNGGLVVHPMFLSSLIHVPDRRGAATPGLSRREQDVLGMLSVGLDTRAIATQLGISLNTCRGYVKTLLGKLNAHSQLEAVAIARRDGLVGDESPR